jgi:hypothetical protein
MVSDCEIKRFGTRVLTCVMRRRIMSRTLVSRILACAHILRILGVKALVLVGVCRRFRVWTVHTTCLGSSSLELTYGCSRKRVVGRV